MDINGILCLICIYIYIFLIDKYNMLIANMYIIYKYQPSWCPTPNSFVISGSRSPNPVNLACGVESQVGQCGRLHQASDLVESTPTAGRFLLWAPRTNRDPKRQDCASFSNWSQGSWSVWNMKAKPKMRIHETLQGKSRTNSWRRLRCSNRILLRELDITRNAKHLQNR